MCTVENFLKGPDVEGFHKLKKDELLSLGVHLVSKVKTSKKKQEIIIVVA
jgi:hypothetical protein